MTVIDDIYKAWKKRARNFSQLAQDLSKELNLKLTRDDIAYVVFTQQAPPHIKKQINAMEGGFQGFIEPDKPQKVRKRRVGRPRKKRSPDLFK